MRARSALLLASIFHLCNSCVLHTPGAASLTPVSQPKAATASLSNSAEILFLVMGDTGRGNAIQARAGKLMADVCGNRRPKGGCDFALVAGDLIYDSGVNGTKDPKFNTHFEQPFSALGSLPMWSVPGNHDWVQAGSVQAQIDYTATSPSGRWRMPFFHFEVPALPDWLHIYGVDTSTMDDVRHAGGEARSKLIEINTKQVQAAKQALCEKQGWRFLFGHHPVYSSGQHGRDEQAGGKATSIHTALVEPLIKACQVQIYFAGHDHMQEHLRAETEKFDQVIEGAVSEVRKNDHEIHLPGVTSKFRRHEYGFALVTATSKSIRVEYFCFREKDNPGPTLQAAYHFDLAL